MLLRPSIPNTRMSFSNLALILCLIVNGLVHVNYANAETSADFPGAEIVTENLFFAEANQSCANLGRRLATKLEVLLNANTHLGVALKATKFPESDANSSEVRAEYWENNDSPERFSGFILAKRVHIANSMESYTPVATYFSLLNYRQPASPLGNSCFWISGEAVPAGGASIGSHGSGGSMPSAALWCARFGTFSSANTYFEKRPVLCVK